MFILAASCLVCRGRQKRRVPRRSIPSKTSIRQFLPQGLQGYNTLGVYSRTGYGSRGGMGANITAMRLIYLYLVSFLAQQSGLCEMDGVAVGIQVVAGNSAKRRRCGCWKKPKRKIYCGVEMRNVSLARPIVVLVLSCLFSNLRMCCIAVVYLAKST